MRPDWCPQEVWGTADHLFRCSSADVIARALLEAEQRGRRKGLEEGAEIFEAEGRFDISAPIRAKLDEVQK